jgi:hypothetical protein
VISSKESEQSSKQEQPLKIMDCEGKHGLPVIDGQEKVYPILLNLLNYVQEKAQRRVVVTSGHRCPIHNTYVDSSSANQTSKHQIGAAVCFYVEGMENQPEAIVGLLMQYYREHPSPTQQKSYLEFQRYEKKDTDVSTAPWYNKEVFIKLYRTHEGRNFDNSHPYPFISLQVRYDREKGQPVSYSWKQANQGYKRS